MKKTLAVVIHARTQSTRVPNKHLRDLGNDKTLIDIAINNVLKIKNVNEKYLACHGDELKERANGKINILERSYESVKPGNAPHEIMYEHLKDVKSDYILNYNPCQPFLNIKKVQKVIDWFLNSQYESAITVRKKRNFYWDEFCKPINFKENDRLSTTAGPFLYEATHSLVFYKKEYMLKNWQLFSNTKNDPYPLIVDWDEKDFMDVDTELDFINVKNLINED